MAFLNEPHYTQDKSKKNQLEKKLQLQLQNDFHSIYKKSIFCDWIIRFPNRTIKANKCIIETRCPQFYETLSSTSLKHIHSKNLVENICIFIDKIYSSTLIEIEEESKIIAKITSYFKPKKTATKAELEQEIEEQEQLSELLRSLPLPCNSDMDSGLETGGSDASAHEPSHRTKEQKQKQNEEILNMDASTHSGSWENLNANALPRPSSSQTQNHYFIDASSLFDENEINSLTPTQTNGVSPPKVSNGCNSTTNDAYSSGFYVADTPKTNNLTEKSSQVFFRPIRDCTSNDTSGYDGRTNNLTESDLKASTSDSSSSYDSKSDPDEKSKEVKFPATENSCTRLTRGGTFDMEHKDHRLRKQIDERRQGALVFQNSITQYSMLQMDCVLPTTPHNSIVQIETPEPSRQIDTLFRASATSSPIPVRKQIKRDESAPIVSGGVSALDFTPPKSMESPLSRRKTTESTPIVSGGSVLEPQEATPRRVSIKDKPAVKSCWVVDMSQPPDVKQSPEPPVRHSESPKPAQKTSLGFYVDLSDVPDTEPPASRENSPQPTTAAAKANDKKNIFSMVIDFEAPKKEMPSRLCSSLYSKKPEKTRNKRNDSISQSVIVNETEHKENASSTVVAQPEPEPEPVSAKAENDSAKRHSWNTGSESDSATLGQTSNGGDTKTDSESHNAADTSSSPDDTEPPPPPPPKEDMQSSKEDDTSNKTFVKLSDLTCTAPKIELEPMIPTRMSRSIPETSWIESQLLMSRSTGYRSTPRAMGADTDISELSDFSSLHSSTALEISTDTSFSQPRKSATRLGNDLLRMFLDEISPDVIVEVDGKQLKAHKCILSSRCQYFAAMLSGDWLEAAGNIISLQGFTYPAVYFALCHIYSGSADVPDHISLVELATLADMLGLEGLKEVVSHTLKVRHCHSFHRPCGVCASGVMEVLPLASAYGLDELYRKALRWITRYFVRVWPTRAFATLPRELQEKCYQQHVVHMSPDSVLETILCCDKLLATIPAVRWADTVVQLTVQLAGACQHYLIQHFSSVLASTSFLALGKELSWNIGQLEEGLLSAATELQPDQACRSYAKIHKLIAALDDLWSSSFIDFVNKIELVIEQSVIRQALRISRTPAWSRLDPVLRQHIQETCCLPLDKPRAPRQSRSTSGSRSQDLKQVRLAMQQHNRRAQSSDNRPAPPAAAAVATVKAPQPQPRAPNRPRTWPARKVISSSDSSRTSSPAMKRANQRTLANDMSRDSLASPKPAANAAAAAAAKANTTAKQQRTTSTTASTKTVLASKTKQAVTAGTVKKSSSEKSMTTRTSAVSASKRSESKPPGGAAKQQSQSGSSSSAQGSPSSMVRNRSSSQTNGSPSLRRSLLLAAKAPQVTVKPMSPATNKRIARMQASQSLTNPTKSSAAKSVNATARTKTESKTSAKTTTTSTAKTSSAAAKKQQQHQQKQRIEQETITNGNTNANATHTTTTNTTTCRAPVERSGTFLKDEPTILGKNVNV